MSSERPLPASGGRSDSLPPLPRGRHRLPLEAVLENQRRRLIAGVAKALTERGYAELTVQHVIETAGVSRTTFYANFDNKRDCVLAAREDAFDRLLSCIVRACATEREWPEKVRAATAAIFAFAAADPPLARLLTNDALAADQVIARRIVDSNNHLAALLRDGRRYAPMAFSLPDVTEAALIGGVSTVIDRWLLDGRAEKPPPLEAEAIQFLLTPYLGASEAERIATTTLVAEKSN
jgi:AcrR family transcriptional regulator